MADLFDPASQQQQQHQQTLESDDISSLLNTLLQNSSQASTSSTSAHLILDHHQQDPSETRRQFLGSAVFSRPSGSLDSSSNLNFPFPGAFYNSHPSNNAFSTDGVVGDIDCDSEEQEEAPVNPAPARSSSKRSRAADVHNLSEKRRRQRINEKMKALQKLIPNSNKTDKASMLDEAIEYLKQLQLQVQMLTMRNGSNLHPFYLPGVAQPMQSAQAQVAPLIDETNSSSRVGLFAENNEASMHDMFDLSRKPEPSDYKLLMNRMSDTSNSGPSVVLEPSANTHYRCVNAAMSSKVLCKGPALPQLQLEMSRYGNSSSSDMSS